MVTVNFKHISHLALVFSVSIADFEQVNPGRVVIVTVPKNRDIALLLFLTKRTQNM